jgi:pimeloyl-ACP methyl ester carboxylesterase
MPAAKPTSTRNTLAPPPKSPPEIVDPAWLLQAIGLCLVAALVCAWLAACFLVYQGEWQLVLHPSHTIEQTPNAAGLAYADVAFGASETGQPRLTGWWIPAGSDAGFQAKYAAYTILYLHDGSGSLSNTVPMIVRLHRAGLNVFAFDYRGFGASDASAHPSNLRMTEDAASALDYLTSTRHIPTSNIVPYGTGLGASPAAQLALGHSGLPAVILDNPDPDPASTAVAAHPSKLIPVRLLFGDQFDIAKPIEKLAAPKLLIAGGSNSDGGRDLRNIRTLFRQAASPSFAVTLPPRNDESAYQAALSRFLDQYLSAHQRS